MVESRLGAFSECAQLCIERAHAGIDAEVAALELREPEDVGHDATEFRSTGAVQKRADPKTHGAEGRFDCQTGEYGYLYAGETKKTTIAEAFLRGDVVADPSARILRRAKADNTVLSRIEVAADLTLVDLRGAAGLGRVGLGSPGQKSRGPRR